MRHSIICRYSISLKYKTSDVRSLSVKYCDVHPQNPSKQNKITSMFLPLASVTSRSPFSANLMVASCEREIPDIRISSFSCCGHFQYAINLTTSLNSSHGSMAPWLGPSSLGWEPQFPVSSSKSSLYLKSKMIEIQTWKRIVGAVQAIQWSGRTNLSKDSSENNFFPTAGVYYLLDFLLNGSECRALLLQEVRHTLGVLANCCCLKIHPAESRMTKIHGMCEQTTGCGAS